MAFLYKSNLNNQFQTMSPVMTVPITNGVAIVEGTLVYRLNGRVSIAPAGGPVEGIARVYDGTTLTGNAAGTVTVEVERIRSGDILEVEQLLIADAACQAGDFLDYDGPAVALAAAAQNDLVVIDVPWRRAGFVPVSIRFPQYQ